MSKAIKGRIFQAVPGTCPYYEVACDQATYDQLVKQAAAAQYGAWRQFDDGRPFYGVLVVGTAAACAALDAIGIKPTKS